MICANLTNLRKDIEILTEAGVDMLHWDIQDGVYVHNFALSPDIIKACRPLTEIPFDVHSTLVDPASFIPEIIDAGGDIISLQFETTPHIFRSVEQIHKSGRKAGIVLMPITTLSQIEYVLPEVQMVTLMTVDLGFAGQKFIRSMLDKIRTLRSKIEEQNLDIDIMVDGQINFGTFDDVVKAGANVLVVGTSGIFTVHEDLKTAVQIVREKINSMKLKPSI